MTSSSPLAPGTTVQWRREVGVVRQVLGSGHAYRVAFTDGQQFVCLAAVLNPAPSNVTVFRTKDFVAGRTRPPISSVSAPDEALRQQSEPQKDIIL